MYVAPELKEFAKASADSGEVRSVVVELVVRPVAAPVRPSVSAPKRRASTAAASSSGAEHDYRELAQALDALGLRSPPVKLEAVGAFVVDVTAAELRRILELPGVGAVRPNRTHRAPKQGSARGVTH